jgi:hypothetical protein
MLRPSILMYFTLYPFVVRWFRTGNGISCSRASVFAIGARALTPPTRDTPPAARVGGMKADTTVDSQELRT